MDYVVEVAISTRKPLTEAALTAVAEVGGAAGGIIGGRRLETTLTVKAATPADAAATGVDIVTGLVAGVAIAANAMTVDEADRRDAERVEVVGVTEIAGMLGISKQRVSALSQRDDFPAPLARLASGPVWRAGDLSTFADGWRRLPGRPPKTPMNAGMSAIPPVPPGWRTR